VGYVSIGERIAMLRRRRGMSQEAVAGRLGMSVQWLSNIERGVRTADRYSILAQIADVELQPASRPLDRWTVEE
jgi:transcriptional regulator with XRE-family HTH domain